MTHKIGPSGTRSPAYEPPDAIHGRDESPMPPKRETGLAKFARELKLAREAAGLSTKRLAQAVHVAVGTINNWEQARRCPDTEDVQRVEKALKEAGYTPNGFLVRILEDFLKEEVSPEWSEWRRYEEAAHTLYSYEHSVVPGLLQTEEYARVLLGHDRFSPLPVEERLRNRMERQKIFEHENHPTCVFIFSEDVLYNQAGSKKAMYEQIVHLIEMAQRDDIYLQVVPRKHGYHAGQAGAFMMAKLNGKEVILQDGIHKELVLKEDVEVATLTNYWQHCLSKSLTAEATLDLLKKVAEEWK